MGKRDSTIRVIRTYTLSRVRYTILALMLAAVAASSIPASAQIVVADKGDQKLSISGYLQPQYTRIDIASSEPQDTTVFRRMVLSFQATANKQWLGTVPVRPRAGHRGRSRGRQGRQPPVTGWKDRGVTITIGNQKPPFSRSLITSSARRSFVERPATGDRSLGSLGRALGIKTDFTNHARTLLVSGMIASALHAPGVNQIRTDGITEADSDWNQGILFVGRAEIQPLGEMAREQGTSTTGPGSTRRRSARMHGTTTATATTTRRTASRHQPRWQTLRMLTASR